MMKIWISLTLLLWTLTSCAPTSNLTALPETNADPSPAPIIEATPSKITNPVNPTPMPDTTLQNLIDRAKDDLATRLKIAPSAITLLSAKSVNWSDASLGCPQPDMVYAQVITPGYLIVLEAAGVNFEYHASRSSEVFYCKNPKPPTEFGIPADQ